MLEAIIQSTLLVLSISFALFLPGWLMVRLWFREHVSALEQSLIAFAHGLTLTDGLVLVLDRFGVPLTFTVLASAFALINLALGLLVWKQKIDSQPASDSKLLTSRTWTLLLFMLVLTISVKAFYLIPAGLPTATDMGHHMYWSQYIAAEASLPTYEKIEVVNDLVRGEAIVAAPKPIADFIIGEHIPFAVIAILSKLSFIGSFPVLFLLFINLLSLIAFIALALRIGERALSPQTLPWFVVGTFLFIGPLFTIASPQAKFVSGGVVGNTFGNLLIPIILLVLFRGLREGLPRLVTLSLILLATLAYTHHLSTLVLGFIVIGTFIVAALMSFRELVPLLQNWLRTAFRLPTIITIICILGFGILIALPSYLDTAAIDSAIGSPVKTTRTGLTFLQVSNSIGIVKAALALVGIVLLVVGVQKWREKDALAWALLVGWGGMLSIMALEPSWVLLDIPSNRVGSYLVYPAALLAGLALTLTFEYLARDRDRFLSSLVGLLLIGIIVGNGLFENSSSLIDRSKNTEAQEVFAASRYLGSVTTSDDMILKDHNYLAADAWMKLFFLRDYGYPLSRGLFSRYSETGNRRERCTLVMIASPNNEEAKRCFASTGTNYIVVNPTYDAVQFEKSSDFSKVYSSNHVAVFRRLP